jgi:hypothetical protein
MAYRNTTPQGAVLLLDCLEIHATTDFATLKRGKFKP